MTVPALLDLLRTPTPALADTVPCPPDSGGVRWRSRISGVLEARARATGQSELQVLTTFLREMGVAPLIAARIEAGRLAPTREYRERAAQVLGVSVAELFEELPDVVDAA